MLHRNLYLILIIFCLLAMVSTGCIATTPSTPFTPTLTATVIPPTATITPTIIWFPPTSTPTPFQTRVVTPTVDMRPKIGKVLLEDNFSQPNAWALSQTANGSAAFGNNELTIAIGEVNAYIYSVRKEPVFSNFYLEITAEPNLCKELDEYGVLFRVTSTGNHYRFSLSCNGQVRLDRISGGTASSPQPWILSGSVPPGAPSSSIIGISANGPELRFFINGEYQFTINDPLLISGGIGVFARSTNKSAVTVNFSHLVVYEINK